MRSFTDLPSEVQANIFSWLDPFSIIQLQSVSKDLRSITQSDHVLRRVCTRAGYMQGLEDIEAFKRPREPDSQYGTAHDHAKQPAYKASGRPETDFRTYQSLLLSTYALETVKTKSDLRNAYSLWFSSSFSADIWRAHIDHIDNVLVTTSADDDFAPTVEVFDMKQGAIMYSHPAHLTAPSAHLEASQGWFVHTHVPPWHDGHDQLQLWCLERVTDAEKPRVGYLVDKGEIEPLHAVQAYRLHFPDLLVASENQLTMYDVTSKEVVLEIPIAPLQDRRVINAVEFDKNSIWVVYLDTAQHSEMRSYCRQTHELKATLRPDSDEVSNAQT
ncbi:unnamed protein product [Sympodiomycopsis kandeliae]